MDRKTLEQYALFLDQNINEVQFGVYSIGALSLLAAFRRVRPFSRFSRPADIPKRFIRTRTKLHGTVERIEPTGALLMVQHEPLIRILRSKVDSLPVKISGVAINGNGISWLQSIVAGNKITFVPVLQTNNCVECEVMLEQNTKDNKTKTLYVGPAIVSTGFAQVKNIPPPLSTNQFHLAYHQTLQEAALMYERKRLGNWYYVKTTQDFSLRLLRLLLTSMIALFKSRTSVKAIENVKIKKLNKATT